jgi:hypothetical protein
VNRNGAIRILGRQPGGLVRGRTAPTAAIEAINLSESVDRRLRFHDTRIVARADGHGGFAFTLPAQEGDLVHLRSRGPRGKVGPWLILRLRGVGEDRRRVPLCLFRIGLVESARDRVEVFRIDRTRPVGEPWARVRFVNRRTGQEWPVTLNAGGVFCGRPRVPGRAGDVLSVFATDGLRQEIGKLTVPELSGAGSATPALCRDGLGPDGSARFAQKLFPGRLFRGAARAWEVRQGDLADCHFSAAASALAAAQPESLPRILRDNGNGTYTATFKRLDRKSRSYRSEEVTVTSALYVRPSGHLLYGWTPGAPELRRMALWWPILEKAYAAWHQDSYHRVGQGGTACGVLAALLGGAPREIAVAGGDRSWRQLRDWHAQGRPLVAATGSLAQTLRYRNHRIFPCHSYSVLDCEETRNGRVLLLHNPWGQSTPDLDGGLGHGIFRLDLDRFVRLFVAVQTVAPARD